MDGSWTQGTLKEDRRVENERMECRGNNSLLPGERRREERKDIRRKRRVEEKDGGQNKESKNREARNGQTEQERKID